MSQLCWESLRGDLRAFGIKSDSPCLPFLCFIFMYRPHIPHPTHCTDSHIPFTIALKTDLLQFPPWCLCSYSLLSLFPHLPSKYRHTLQVLSQTLCPPLNPALTIPSLWRVRTTQHQCPHSCHNSLSAFLQAFTSVSLSRCSPSACVGFQGRSLGFTGLHISHIQHTYLPRKDLEVKKEEGGKKGGVEWKGSVQCKEYLMVLSR